MGKIHVGACVFLFAKLCNIQNLQSQITQIRKMLNSGKFKSTSGGFLCFIALVSLNGIVLCDVPRPIGVSLTKATLYKPSAGDTWQCLDGSKSLKFIQINDDYCDCPDGSDEPGTAACPHTTFHCANQGHRSQDIPSTRVNDGICDCCDGSDEYQTAKCSNSCDEMGRAEREQRKSQAEILKKGSAKRSEMVSRGQQLKAERETRRRELEQRRQEQESLKREKEELKKQAESIEAEAIAYFKELHKDAEVTKTEVEADSEPKPEDLMNKEVTELFSYYDTNKDGFIEIIELQVDIRLDRDHNGMVSSNEAKYYLDERERVDFDSFKTLSWPRIKPQLMIKEGIFKPPQSHGDDATDEDSETEEYRNPELDEMLREYNERGEGKNILFVIQSSKPTYVYIILELNILMRFIYTHIYVYGKD